MNKLLWILFSKRYRKELKIFARLIILLLLSILLFGIVLAKII